MTKVYGCSDDLIEFEGDVYGEVGCFGTDDQDHGVLVTFSDGTLLEVKYGKADQAIWGITVIKKGDLFDDISYCSNDEDDSHSDVVKFKDGLNWAYASTDWGKVN